MPQKKRQEKSRWISECLFVFGIVAYSAVLACQTPGYSAATRMFPTIVLWFFAVLLAFKIYSLIAARKFIAPAEEKKETPIVPFNGMSQTRAVLFSIFWIVATTAVFYFFGMLPATAAMSFAFWLFYAKRKAHIAAFLSVGLTISVYVIFVLFLNIRNYTGELFY